MSEGELRPDLFKCVGHYLGNRSIRIPSGFNGLYSLKPSYNRVPYGDCVDTLDGQETILAVLGPISTSLHGVKQFMKIVLSAQAWNRDPTVLRMKWNEEAYKLGEHGGGEPLCFGMLWHDSFAYPHPPVIRALEMVKNALIAKGHRGTLQSDRLMTHL